MINCALDLELAALALDKIAAQQEAQTASAFAGCAPRRHPLIELEQIIDLVWRDSNASVGDRDLDVGQRNILEFGFELVGVIAFDDIFTGQLKDVIVLRRLAKPCFEVGPKQPFARTGPDEVNHFRIATWLRCDSDGNTVMAATDSQIAVMNHD